MKPHAMAMMRFLNTMYYLGLISHDTKHRTLHDWLFWKALVSE